MAHDSKLLDRVVSLTLTLLLAGAFQAGAAAVAYDDLPAERVNYYRNWRDARRVETAEVVIDLGVAVRGHAVRFGVLPPANGKQPVVCRIEAGEQEIRRLKTKPRHTWCNYRVYLPPEADGRPCRLRLSCPGTFWVAPCELTRREKDAPPNVLIYLIDTLRLDHVSAYGYERKTTPRIDAFAEDAVRFLHATPQSSWTRPSVASLLTGTWPGTHGARDSSDVMREGLPSIARALAELGYETHAFMSNDNCMPRWNIGNDFFNYSFVHPVHHDAGMADEAIHILKRTVARPWFAFVHVMGPHSPYAPPVEADYVRFQPPETALNQQQTEELLRTHGALPSLPAARRLLGVEPPKKRPAELKPLAEVMNNEALRQLCRDIYDGDIYYSDRQFGRVVDALKETGLYDNTIVLLLSDHGEEFWEHGGFYHGKTLYEDQLRIPFILKLPEQRLAGSVREGVVNLSDVAPTLLDLLGAPQQDRFQGASFRPLLEQRGADSRLAYASLFSVHFRHNLRAAKDTRLKYIQNLNTNQETWYNLGHDPLEQHPLDEPEAGEPLKTLAARLGRLDATGLHVLFTDSLQKGDVITGSIRGEGLGELTLDFPPAHSDLQRIENGWKFELRMQTTQGLVGFMQDNQALFRVDIPGHEKAALEVSLNGTPFPEDAVHIGPEKRHGALDGAPLPMADLTATPNHLNLATLPEKLAAYVWYVPPAETVPEEELSPEMRENLRALGYLE